MQRWVVVLLPVGTANPSYSITIQLMRFGHNCTTALRTAINKHCLISAFPHNNHGTSATSTPLEEKQHAKLFGCVVWGWLLAIVWDESPAWCHLFSSRTRVQGSPFGVEGGQGIKRVNTEHNTRIPQRKRACFLVYLLSSEKQQKGLPVQNPAPWCRLQ